MRLLVFFLLLAGNAAATVPAELASALQSFRADPPRGWSFTQTTRAEGKTTVERSNAAKPDFERWTLLEKDGRPPTAEELASYTEGRSRRSRAGTAPNLADQLLVDAAETIGETVDRVTFRCPLRRGESRDQTAPHLRATIVVHKPTRTIESVQLANAEPFRPAVGVRISEFRTVMTYSLPADERPSLPQRVTTHVRGTAFFFKSLDADMSVTFSDYERAGRKPPTK